jgi:2'-5' RNA ligase
MGMELKRLFLGMEVVAPWPESLPKGRILDESDRHLTLAFLGDANLPQLQELLNSFPKPPFQIGLAGIFDKALFLRHVAAWHIQWLEREELFLTFQKNLVNWLKSQGLHPKEGKFLSHVTLARRPFSTPEWQKSFHPLPMYVKNIHLCESLGNSEYEVCWNFPILAPFDEIEHTADIAFLVRGENLQQLFLHAQLALCFHFPPMLTFIKNRSVANLDEIVAVLNGMILKADIELGCPFKAVSFHGELQKNQFLEWEMIVDV